MIALALNSGSSSLKFGLFRVQGTEAQPLLQGQLDALSELPGRLTAADAPSPEAVGHRIVHGGPALRTHAVLHAAVLQQIKAAVPLAPVHLPAALEVIGQSMAMFPGLPQVVCVDTAFHNTLREEARVLPIPRFLQAQGFVRYGFHGLSCESILHQLARDEPNGLPPGILIAHLGHGASVSAVRNGQSIDTSMGLTPTGGLIMGTRSGDMDPGVLIHLLHQLGGDPTALATMLEQQSGLLGISGLSSDMRRLQLAAATHADARLAVHMFCISVAKQLAAMFTVLDTVDLLVFSGGIGENDSAARQRICAALACLGVKLDADRNAHGQGVISCASSRCAVRVLAAQEEAQIARHTAALLQKAPVSTASL